MFASVAFGEAAGDDRPGPERCVRGMNVKVEWNAQSALERIPSRSLVGVVFCPGPPSSAAGGND